MSIPTQKEGFSFSQEDGAVQVMGVLNLSPDSFYEQSRAQGLDAALELARRMAGEGADLIDVGAESSRPGSRPIDAALEIERLLPLVRRLARECPVPVSVDTWKAPVAEQVLDAGAALINDITGLRGDPEMARTVARHRAGVVLMHMQGRPEYMQEKPVYGDLIEEIKEFLGDSLRLAREAGIGSAQVAIDPGIGFGKTLENNLEILARLDEFGSLGAPLLLGVSRKSFIGKVLDLPVEERLEGSLAAAVAGVFKGAKIIRAHDVAATVRAVKVATAIKQHERTRS